MKRKYAGSANLQGVLKLLNDFWQSHSKIRYRADLRQFIRESKLEDLVSTSSGTIFVSTIHQTKGREFDHVFLALSRFPKMDDETRRAIYVAITRAKQSMRIFCNGNFFDGLNVENISRSIDETMYPEPSRICLQLSHKDVYLNHFSYCQKEIGRLISGQKLSVQDTGCFWGDKAIVRFSAKFRTRINDLKVKGYTPEKAYIRHVIFWNSKNQEEELKIVLPNIELLKRN